MKAVDQLPLNEVQLSLLRMFSRPMSEEQTLKIRRALVQFLSDELDTEIEKVVTQKKHHSKGFWQIAQSASTHS